MELSSFISVVLFGAFSCSIYAYAYIIIMLELAGIRIDFMEKIFLFLNSILIPPSFVALFYVLFRVFLIVPRYTAGNVPPGVALVLFLLFLYGILSSVDHRECYKKGINEMHHGFAEMILTIHLESSSRNLYVSMGGDWRLRVQCLILHLILGEYVRFAFYMAGLADSYGYRLQNSSFVLCFLITELRLFLKIGVPFLFLVSGYPLYVYVIATITLFSYSVVCLFLNLNYSVNRYYLLLRLRQMGDASSLSDKRAFLLSSLRNPPPTEEMFYSFCSQDPHMKAILPANN